MRSLFNKLTETRHKHASGPVQYSPSSCLLHTFAATENIANALGLANGLGRNVFKGKYHKNISKIFKVSCCLTGV